MGDKRATRAIDLDNNTVFASSQVWREEYRSVKIVSPWNYLHGVPGGAMAKQQPDDLHVLVLDRIVEWRVVLVPGGVHQRVVLQQQLHHLQVPMTAGFVLSK